ncbi:MAG: hypothetical protein WC455_06920 [Dehalococcoidia bacterium]|jgi:hypothetical protein
MAEVEIVYVAVIPQDYPSINLAKAVSGIIGKDAYQTRLLLAGSIPRVVARCVGVAEAKALACKLRETGLTTIVCSDAELRGPFQGVRAKTLEFGDRGVTFKAEGGEGVTLGAGSVFLIIKGTRHPDPEVEDATAKTKRKLNVGATLMTGGIPIFKKVKEKPKTVTPENEWFLRFYERALSEPRVEILQYDIDYSFLGAETTLSSTANFINVVKRLRAIYPQAIYDERLMKTFSTDIPMTTPEEDLDINCRLIYFQRLP